MSGREHLHPWDVSDAEFYARLEDARMEPRSIEDQINDIQAEMLATCSPERRAELRAKGQALVAFQALGRIA